MKIIKIDKKEWKQGIDKSRKDYKFFGPVKDKNYHLVKELGENDYPDMDLSADTILSPKSVIFPQTEKMLTANLDESQDNHHIMERADTDYSPRAVLGIKPYDAKAFKFLELNFDTEEYKDPYFCDAMAATTFIGLAVNNPSKFDFSTSVGTGPFDEAGLDVLLVDTGDEYLAKILTDKGEAFLSKSGFKNQADEAASLETISKLKNDAEKTITSEVSHDKLKGKTILELYNASFWDDAAFSCINCGTCTYVCPTCWCFDIQDETKDNFCTRYKNWDTCMSRLFTEHATGHNPREGKVSRVRQRFMHKLKYFLDKYDQGLMCVGCGRCVKHCPVNIDIREICEQMNSYEETA
jgi:formate hydrogenlyase subunit 6/NADH:ubiquinone oxidoreductase subunit I